MALTGTNRGTGTHNTGAANFSLSPGSNFAAGSLAVLCVAADNNSSGGSTNNITSITDNAGNTWNIVQAPIFDNGAAAAGVQGVIAISCMNIATVTTLTSITVNFGTSTTAKTWTLTEIAPGTGRTVRYVTGGVTAGQTTTTPTMTTGTITNGNMVVTAFFVEAGTTQTLSTDDTDSTNGNWTTSQYTEIGSTTSGSVIATNRKVVTATATQTYNLTFGISSDIIGAWAAFAEVPMQMSQLGVL